MELTKFYRCAHCGNIVEFLTASGVPVVCCGEKMQLLTANSTDAAVEKHVPAVTVTGNVVAAVVGSTLHPATMEHHIEWLYLQTEQGGQFKKLNPLAEPRAEFAVTDGDKPIAVFAYCNLHGLWVKSL